MLKEPEIDYRSIFDLLPGNFLIARADPPEYTIVYANQMYLRSTGSDDSIIGKPLFVAFPDNPGIPDPTGVKNLRDSLDEVIRTGRPHEMKIQRYDTPKRKGEGFVVKYWKPLNIPLLNENGETSFIIHSVKNVTDVVMLRNDLEQLDIESQRLISDAVITTQELERLELSQELHDNISQLLNTARLYLGQALNASPVDPNMVRSGHDLVMESMNAIKTLASTLSTNQAENVSLINEIKEMLDHVKQLVNIEVTSKINKKADTLNNEMIIVPVLRIIREHLSNVIKHADATKLHLELTKNKKGLRLYIEDNGKGFKLNKPKNGMGLRNIRSRVAMINGDIDIKTGPGKGCCIEINIPLEPEKKVRKKKKG